MNDQLDHLDHAVRSALTDIIATAPAVDDRVALPSYGTDHSDRRRHPLLAVAAVAALAVGVAGTIAVVTRAPNRTVFGESTAVPSPPSPLTDGERAAALARCINEASVTSDTAGVVDARPDGLLVGLSTSDAWSTCFFPSASPQTPVNPVAPIFAAMPNALLPVVSPSRPIVVVDASAQKGTDGPQGSKVIDGSEVSWVWGRIDPTIVTVIVTTRTARYVPTITDGLFAAWWRGNNSQEMVVRGFDSDGNEVAFVDQVDCYAANPVTIDGRTYTPPSRRLVVQGDYVEGGCIGGEHVKPGATADEIGDPK